jgi:hypothetical protein
VRVLVYDITEFVVLVVISFFQNFIVRVLVYDITDFVVLVVISFFKIVL